jgi:hypothetical protein
MAKRLFAVLTIGMFCAVACLSARAQAVAESAIMHANSGISGSVARALGGNIQQGLSKTQSQFSYPPRTSRAARHARAYRAKTRKGAPGRSSIAISSVIGSPAPCPAAPAAAQAKLATGSASGNCAAKTPPPAASAKSNPNEITVSF